LGIFLFTIMRLFTWRSLLSLFALTVLFPLVIGVSTKTSDEMAETVYPMMIHTILPMVIGFMIVSDTVANHKNLSDGEYLSLLFTRPISRANYIITKWLAGTTGVALCVYFAYAVFLFGTTLTGANKAPELLEIVNILLNCMSAVALVVLIA